MGEVKVVVEHLEPYLTRWMLLEYTHVSRIWGKDAVAFTRVPRKYHEILEQLGAVYEEPVEEVFPEHKLVILDPKAEQPLTPEDFKDSIIVIGGIMGDHPPKGRTWELLSSRLKRARKRNLGPHQLSIDGAALVAKMIYEGRRLGEIELKLGITLSINTGFGTIEVELPFAYPVINGKTVVTPGLEELLRKGVVYDEVELLGAR